MKNIFKLLFILFLGISNVSAHELIEAKFSKCVDGDTAYLIINKEEKKFRFLAIDTPETVAPKKGKEPFGEEASNFTCNSLKNAKKIEVLYDDNAKSDKYGRELAYIFLDGEMLQKQLLKKGLAKVAYIYANYLYTEELCEVEIEAYHLKEGIWSIKNNELGYCQKYYEEEKNIDSEYEYIFLIILFVVALLTGRKKRRKKL